ncbi:DNA-binding transcriptional regulator, LysR family [Burkholderia sp. GAS332]|nr:DNA-binding transcriptional regulator, LysR family [Burkholderia sp. GAS332]
MTVDGARTEAPLCEEPIYDLMHARRKMFLRIFRRAMDYVYTLRTFCAVVELRSFRGAADMLGTSPAVISRAVMDLERRLGVRLFNRTTRQTSLTEIAESFYIGCTRVLTELDALEDAVSAHAREPGGMLRLVAHTTATTNLLTPLITSFKLKQPKIGIDVTLTEGPVDMVTEGFDIGLVLPYMLNTDMVVTRLLDRMALFIVASPEYLKRHPAPRHPTDLVQHIFVVLSRAIQQPELTFLVDGERLTVPIRHEISSNSARFNHSLVQQGFGLGILPIAMIREDIESGRLVQLMEDFELADATVELKLAYRSRSLLPKKVRTFIGHSVAHFQQSLT